MSFPRVQETHLKGLKRQVVGAHSQHMYCYLADPALLHMAATLTQVIPCLLYTSDAADE